MASEVIKLNIIPTGEMPVFHCSQFDNGRLINIELYRGEDAYTIPSGCTAELHCRKVDNNIVTIGSPVIDENTIKFTSTTQLTACNGKNLCEVAILGADDYLIGSLNFWLEVEVDPLKGGITSTSEIHNLESQIEEITTEIIGENYYDKSEVDDLLDAKADASSVYTKTETDAKLALKANANSVYTKSETDTLLLAKADASSVYTKTETDAKLALKANANSVYTKSETDTLLLTKADASDVYTKGQVETKLAAKADATDVYTKTEVNTALGLKANAADVYNKSQVDTALALKANTADVYTKAETDAKIEEAIEEILPVDTAGPSAIANFTTGLALPLVNCSVGITATGGNGTPSSPIPIVGYTEANITRCGVNLFDNSYPEIGNGTVYTIAFGQTVYGGVLDVTRGKLTVTHKYITRTWGQFGNKADLTNNTRGSLYISSEGKGVDNNPTDICNIAPYQYSWGIDSNHFYILINGEDTILFVFLPNGTSDDTEIQVCYELDTPFDIDLTPVQIRALVGTNNVYSDTNGDTTVKFKDTIQNYIDKKVST